MFISTSPLFFFILHLQSLYYVGFFYYNRFTNILLVYIYLWSSHLPAFLFFLTLYKYSQFAIHVATACKNAHSQETSSQWLNQRFGRLQVSLQRINYKWLIHDVIEIKMYPLTKKYYFLIVVVLILFIFNQHV